MEPNATGDPLFAKSFEQATQTVFNQYNESPKALDLVIFTAD